MPSAEVEAVVAVDNINSDLEPAVNDVPNPVETIDVPESDPGQWNPFAGNEEDVSEEEQLFYETPEERNGVISPVRAADRPVATSLLALTLSDASVANDLTILNQANLEAARNLLDDYQEYNARLRVAANRSIDTLKYVDQLQKDMESRARDGEAIPEGVADLINRTYQDVVARDLEDSANYALEMEAVERIRDFMTQGDEHEAYLVKEHFFGDGGAEQRIIDEMTKDLIVAQRIEELEAEYDNSGWIRGFVNGVIRLVPMFDSFSASGILDDAGIDNGQASGIIPFILRGSNIEQQRDALYGLPLSEFAAAMTADGPVMKSLRANADWIMADPARAREVGTLLLSPQNQSTIAENFMGGLDAGFLALPALAKTTRLLSGAGARKAATDLTTKAVLETIANGPEAAKKATTLGTEEVTENLTPLAFRSDAAGAGMSADIVANLRAAEEIRRLLPDIMASQRLDNPEELRAAYEALEKELKNDTYGKFIKDVKYVQENVRTGKTKEFDGVLSEDGATIYRVEVLAGKKTGGGYAKPGYAKGLFKRFGREGSVVKDPESGQYFAKFEIELPVDGFITADLQTPEAAFAFLRSSARTADRSAVAKGIVAGNSANMFYKKAAEVIKASVKGLSRKQRNGLNEIIKKGQNEAKWYDEAEFQVLYERQTGGQLPTKEVMDAYSTFRSMSDLNYLVRNEAEFLTKYNKGYTSHKFMFGGKEVDVDGVLNLNPAKRPVGGRLWDADNKRWLADNLPSDEIKKMADEGYVQLRLDHDLALPDGSLVRHIMIKRDQLVSRPLRRVQLNYSQGGSRAYDATNFIKQGAEDASGNLISPKTFIAGKNLNEMREWVDKMNAAINLFKKGETDAFRFDDIFQNNPGFPSGEEFLRMIEDGEISTKYLFEVVDDRGLPSAYFGKGPDAMRFVDLEESAIDSYHRSQGRMYYGTKGEALKDTTGDFAQTIDPWETLNASIMEASRVYGFSGYKRNVLERFKRTYGNYLDLDNVEEFDNLYGIVNAKTRSGVDKKIVAKIRQEQSAINRLMNFETGFEKDLRNRWRNSADWILGDAAEGTGRAHARNFMYWLEKNNPVQAIRSFTFDSNLGFFNIGQLLIQSSTMGSAIALSPRYGLKGFKVAPALKQYAVSGYRDDVLDVLAKRGTWKGSFESATEFKEYARFLRDSNLYEVNGHNLAQVREIGANRLFGAAGAYDAVTEKGRMFFYFAEQLNRSVASRIAWGELKEAGVKAGSSEFKEKFAILTDDYSFNMMSQTSAGFQHGLPSIPTQFWAYAFRMTDALFGKRFTPVQKMRLLSMNMMMGGAAGVPGGALVKSIYENFNEEPITIDDAESWLSRGVFDGMIHVLTGADVEVGQKIGTADLMTNVFKDFMGKGDYGEKSALEMFLGAAGGKMGQVAPAMWDVMRYSAAEYGLGGPLSNEAWLRMAKEISTVKNFNSAVLAYKYNQYYSKNGTLIAHDLPDADAFFFALGFGPGQQSELNFYFDQSEKDTVDEAAKQLTKWRQEAFTRPDTYEENRQKAQAFMTLFEPHLQIKIKERASKITSDSMYESVSKRYQQDMVENEFYDEMVPMIENKAGLIDNDEGNE